MKIFGDMVSGNCLKVKYVADYLDIDYLWQDIDIMKQESRSSEYLSLNPAGQVPLLALDDGRLIAQSNAIIQFLVEGSKLLPEDKYERALVNQWLFWEQYSHEPYVAVCRFQMLYLGKPKSEREVWRVEKAESALDMMEHHLSDRDWFVSEDMTIADISLLAYTRLSHEGGFDLNSRPNTLSWVARCEVKLGLASEI